MSANLIQLLAADAALTFGGTTALQDADLDTLLDAVLPSNMQGAIAAENHRKLIRYLFVAGLRYSSIVQTHLGNEATKVLSAAGGKAIADSIDAKVAAGMAALKTDLLGGVSEAFDTLKELYDLGITEQNAILLLQNAVSALQSAGLVKADGSVPVNAPLRVGDATGNAHAVTLRQMEHGVIFAPVSYFSTSTTGVFDLGTVRPVDSGAQASPFIPTGVYVCPKTLGGTLVTAAVVSVGTNSPAYDNIYKGALATAPVLGENIPLSIHAVTVAPGTAIKARVVSAQVGGGATYDLFVLGFYR